MSSYIIAGSADNPDTALCEEIAKRIKAKYSNIDFRIIIKHPSEWENHLQEVCRIYGFRHKPNPIIYTFDGKIIGDKDAFLRTTSKYFGISEADMEVGAISTDVNRRQADEELRKKMKIKNNTKTLVECIQEKIQEKLQAKIFKTKLLEYEKSIEGLLIFYRRQVEGLCTQMVFEVNKKVETVDDKVQPDMEFNIENQLMKDLGQVEESKEAQPVSKEKEAFVTHQDDGQLRRSKTNGSIRLHESSISHDRQSKVSSKQHQHKTQVEQEFFEQSTYYELINIENFIASDLGDEFYLVLNQRPIILGQMEIVKIAPTEQGLFQMDYSKHPREQKGHLAREIKLPSQQTIQQPMKQQEEEPNKVFNLPQESQPQEPQQTQGQETKKSLEPKEEVKQEEHQKTISNHEQNLISNIQLQEEFELQLESNINSKVLNFLRPLSQLELRKVLDVITKTSSICTVQYSQTNPNPLMVVHLRSYIHFAISNKKNQEYLLPNETTLIDLLSSAQTIVQDICFIRQMKFMHLACKTPNTEEAPDKIRKMLQLILKLEAHLNINIGYNLVMTKEYTMLIPLIDSYQTYNSQRLYLDGLAYIGVVHTARTASPYKVVKTAEPKVQEMLLKCSGSVDLVQHIKP